MTALVTAFMADDRQELKPLGIEDPSQGKPFRKRHLGCVLGRAALVEDRPRKVDRNDLGEYRNPHMPGDIALRSEFLRGQRNSLGDTFGVRLNGRLDQPDLCIETLLVLLQARSVFFGNFGL